MYRLSVLFFVLLAHTDTVTAQNRRSNFGDEQPRFRIGIDGTWSYRTAKVSTDYPPFMQAFLKELKSGAGFGADAMYYFRNNLGVGLQYSTFASGNEMTGVSAFDSATKQTAVGMLKDRTTIQFIGPTFGGRFVLGRQGNMHLGFSIGLGYMSYKEKLTVVNRTSILTGGTLGSSTSFTFDVGLSEHIFVGVKVGTTGGALSEIDIDDGTTKRHLVLPNGSKEGLSRIDLGGGLRFMF